MDQAGNVTVGDNGVSGTTPSQLGDIITSHLSEFFPLFVI